MTERMTAAQLRARTPAKSRQLEANIHKAILTYLRLALPDRAVVHHSPNELNLAEDRTAKAIAQNKAKAMGMVTGWPDIEIICGGFYAIEVKTEAKGSMLSPEQVQVGDAIQKAGGKFGVARSVADAKTLLKEWKLI